VGGLVSLGVHQNIAAGLWIGVELFRDENGRAVKRGPGLPTLVLETEHRLHPAQADDVNAEGIHQVRLDLAQHLVWLDHSDRNAGFIQAKCLPQQVDGTHVHAGLPAATQIQRYPIGLLMTQRNFYPLSGVHAALFP
jgi:hypothetical protein